MTVLSTATLKDAKSASDACWTALSSELSKALNDGDELSRQIMAEQMRMVGDEPMTRLVFLRGLIEAYADKASFWRELGSEATEAFSNAWHAELAVYKHESKRSLLRLKLAVAVVTLLTIAAYVKLEHSWCLGVFPVLAGLLYLVLVLMYAWYEGEIAKLGVKLAAQRAQLRSSK